MLASSWPTLLSPVFEVQEPIVPVYFPAPYFDSSTSAIAERERIANAERQRRTQLMEVRREAVKSRREKLKATIPEKDYTEEELAQSKFQVAHMLWQAGRINAARGQLLALLDDYPGTETAHRAKTALARF